MQQPSIIRRLYLPLIRRHLERERQMLFLMGPRQVGKTTLALALQEEMEGDFLYLDG